MRTTITIPDSLYQKALVRMKERDFIAFSDFLQHLIREDTRHLPVTYPPSAPSALALNEPKNPAAPIDPPPKHPRKKH